MSIFKLILGEILFRKTHFLLSLLAATLAATLFVAGPTLIEGYSRQSDDTLGAMERKFQEDSRRYNDQTRRIMLKMGFNLLIVHRDTNMVDLFSKDFTSVDMPQDYVDKLANSPLLTLVNHVVATLRQRIEWKDRQVLLVGMAEESPQPHRGAPKPPLRQSVQPGTVVLGYRLGIGHEEGENIEVLGREFRVARIQSEKGSRDDVTIYMALPDAQSLLNKEGKINQILAIGCRCEGALLPKVRQQLAQVLPDTTISEQHSIALARAEQRKLVDREQVEKLETAREARGKVQDVMTTLDAVLTPLLILICAIWIGLLALWNVRERRAEIGVLRALGVGSRKIATLFLGKAAIVGLLGGAFGFLVGTQVARRLGIEALEVSPEYFTPALGLLLWALLGAPLLSALASYLPTLKALFQDPALVLREE